ncbi:MAG: 3-dehydroquinate synthase [Chloroflexi bacterium RBG_13_51_52]|nr:MAG: 3-dehydroquinate synthase [Chloroflexi bacterium RBG_13_51_52]
MIKVKVELGQNSYEISIGSGLLPRVGLWLKQMGFSGKAVIITDTSVRELNADVLERGLSNAGFTVTVLEVPPGEEQKTLANAGRLYQKMAEAFIERTSPVLALGGGVIGDLAGFIAATYMRGVPLVQVPTTLLAMVDSSVGGKTAVDHGSLKNMIGAFYQPSMVVADMDTLKTLPREEMSNGMAEVIKHAAIKDKGFLDFLGENIENAMSLNPAVLGNILEKNVRIKASVVEADEKESDLRRILNYGHTVGHAVEAVTDFKIKHGQAVAIGMIAAAKISRRLGMLHEDEAIKLEAVIGQAGLPVKLPELNRDEKEKLLDLIKHDKKVRDDKIMFVLLKSLGNAFVSDKVDIGLIGEVLFGWRPA